MPTTTFTPQARRPQRYLTPDLARGFMLLLIVVANTPWWTISAQLPTSTLDRWTLVARTALIDQRAYPLFGMLFGFGLATITRRHLVHTSAAHPSADTRSLLRRRGAWMLVFGAIHALLFPLDILGNYGLATVALAWLLIPPRRGWLVMIALLSFAAGGVVTWFVDPTQDIFASDDHFTESLLSSPFPIPSLSIWAVGNLYMGLASSLTAAIVAGVWIEHRGYLREPRQHRRLLWICVVTGFGLGTLGGIPEGLHIAGLWENQHPIWAILNYLAAPLSALAWLALVALWASRYDNRQPHTWRWWHLVRFLSAIGQRSMTAYLTQSVVMGLIYGRYELPLADHGAATHALIAAGAWLLIGAGCWLLELCGRTGPAEWLLRRLVARPQPRTEVTQSS